MQGNSTVCRNAKEIARYIGVNERAVLTLKDDHNLPAWRFNGSGNWRALKSSLDEWLIKMEKKHLALEK